MKMCGVGHQTHLALFVDVQMTFVELLFSEYGVCDNFFQYGHLPGRSTLG